MPKINVTIGEENLLYVNMIAEKSGRSRYSILSAFVDMAINTARKNEEFRRAAGKKASTVGERLRTIEGHAKLNSALLALMLQCLTPEQADKYNDLKKKYIE